MAKLHLDRLHIRPLSWSSLSSWEYDKDKWACKYLENIVEPSNPVMDFGKFVGTKLATDPKFLPDVPRLPVFEYGINYTFSGIPLVGFLDAYDSKIPAFYEYKTSGNKKRWTKETVKQHGQLDMYAMLLYMSLKIKPEDLTIKLVYIPVIEDGSFALNIGKEKVQVFEVKKTMADILKFASELKRTYKDMEIFAENYTLTTFLSTS